MHNERIFAEHKVSIFHLGGSAEMTQNMNPNEQNNEKKTDPSTYTAYGDPLKNASSSGKDEYNNSTSPMIDKARDDGNIVKRE